jgi:hypothetical protein
MIVVLIVFGVALSFSATYWLELARRRARLRRYSKLRRHLNGKFRFYN